MIAMRVPTPIARARVSGAFTSSTFKMLTAAGLLSAGALWNAAALAADHGDSAASGRVPAAAVTAADAARFLEQSSFGPTPATVAKVQAMGIPGYLTQQFLTPATGYPGYTYQSPNRNLTCPTGSKTCIRDNYTMFPIQMQFFRNALTGPDQLRQRVAFALSQIFVVSGLEVVQPYGMANFQNLLLQDAFGNFQQLLTDVTLSPVMGDYLNMVNNDWNTRLQDNDPNENYAREVMQLFSIGVNELNLDGTPKLSDPSDPTSFIPTYGQEQIDSFSDVFTGWTFAPLPGKTAKFPDPTNYNGVMTGIQTHHDGEGGETLLEDYVLPPSSSMSTDLSLAINNIFMNPNVAPFISKQLIQQLVTSNPSTAYVKAVAEVFNNDGTGVRGNLQAVIQAILTNAEARSPVKAAAPGYGKLREPALMIVDFLRGVGGATQSDGQFLSAQSALMSEPLFDAPNVFNFYQPSYPLPLPGSTLVGPPFEIYDAATAFDRYQFVNKLIFAPIPPDPSVTFIVPTGTSLDLSAWVAAAAVPTTLIQDIDTQFFHGAMSSALINTLSNLIAQIPATDTTDIAKTALYVAITSPEFQVEQ